MSKPYKQKPGNNPGKKPTAKKIASQHQQESQPILYETVAEMNDAATQLLTAWPMLEKLSASATLKQFFSLCHQVTNRHIQRLQEINILIKEQPAAKCIAVAAIIATAANFTEDTADDLVTIVSQKLLHYLIASYDGLAMLADAAQLTAITNRLNSTTKELQELDEQLCDIAYTINMSDMAA